MSESSTKKLIKKIEALPVEERAIVAESVLQSLNPVDSDVEKQWSDVAEERLKEIKSGKVKAIEGDQVFERIQRRFSE